MTKLIRLVGIGLLALLAASPLACNTYHVSVITKPSQADAGMVDDTQFYTEMFNVTMLIQAEGGTGSGVAFDGGTKVLTAAHVVSHYDFEYDSDGKPVVGPDGVHKPKFVIEAFGVMKGSFLSGGKVLKIDEELDLAILELETPWTYSARFTSKVALFQKCWASGHPMGVTDATITEGRIQSLWDDGFIRYSSATAPGNSGGPVFVSDRLGHPVVFSICQRGYVFRGISPLTHLGLGALPEKVWDYVGASN